jgi:hypothetical protein
MKSLKKRAVAAGAGFLLTAGGIATFAAMPAHATTCAPITITTGGTYSGCYTSTDVNTPAVTISTSAAVTISGATITSAGLGVAGGASPRPSLTVTNTTFTATSPGSTPVHQQAVYLDNPAAFSFTHNEVDATQGILVNGEGSTVSGFTVEYNNFTDIGKYNQSDWLAGAVHTENITIPGGVIDWNRITSHYGSSVSEDVFGLVQTNGASGSPVDVSHNLVNGDWPYSGDGSSFSGVAFDLADISGSYMNANNDTAVNYAGSGFAADTGSNITFSNDTAISDGLANDGTTRVNVSYGDGFSTWNNPSYPTSGPNLWVANSTSGHLRWNGSAWERADYYLPVCNPSTACTGNTSLSHDPTATDEANAVSAYESSVTTAGVTIGLTSSPLAPVVNTTAATGVTSSGATLNGNVNPEGQSTTYQFQYGTTTSYGSTAPASPGSAGSGSSAVNESAALTGLAASTTYHYRLNATNGTGTTNGSDQTFTTSAAGTSVAFDATGGGKHASATSLSWTQVVGSGTNRAIVADFTIGDNNDAGCAPVVKDGTTSMTEITAVHTDNQHAGVLTVWGLANPPSGTNTINASVTGCSGTVLEVTGGSESFTGVNQTTPFAGHGVNYGSGATTSVTGTAASSSDLMGEFAANGSAVTSATSPVVSKFIENQDTSSGAGNSAGGYAPATGSAQTANWSVTSDWWGAAYVDIAHA